jgi:hypothetical protein
MDISFLIDFRLAAANGAFQTGTGSTRSQAVVPRRETIRSSAMNITPSGNATGSGIDRQAQDVAPASGFASDDPVTSSQIRGSHPMDAVALSNTRGLATIDTTRPSIDLNAIAVDSYALCRRCRYDRGAGFTDKKRGDNKCRQ